MNLNTAARPKVAVVPLEGDRTPRPLDDSRYAQASPKFSPDGRYLAYCSNESGRPQVCVQASGDETGRELFYRNGDNMMVVPVAIGPAFSAGRPQELWKGSYPHLVALT